LEEKIKTEKKNKGMTLIEVLVVMAIVVLLASLGMPMIRKARVRALIVKTEATISSLEAALSMYGTDFGTTLLLKGREAVCSLSFCRGRLKTSIGKARI